MPAPRFTQIQIPSGASSVTGIATVGNIFNKAITQAQGGLTAYQEGVDKRLQSDIDYNTNNVRRRIEGAVDERQFGQAEDLVSASNLAQYGPRIDRDALLDGRGERRQKETDYNTDNIIREVNSLIQQNDFDGANTLLSNIDGSLVDQAALDASSANVYDQQGDFNTDSYSRQIRQATNLGKFGAVESDINELGNEANVDISLLEQALINQRPVSAQGSADEVGADARNTIQERRLNNARAIQGAISAIPPEYAGVVTVDQANNLQGVGNLPADLQEKFANDVRSNGRVGYIPNEQERLRDFFNPETSPLGKDFDSYTPTERDALYGRVKAIRQEYTQISDKAAATLAITQDSNTKTRDEAVKVATDTHNLNIAAFGGNPESLERIRSSAGSAIKHIDTLGLGEYEYDFTGDEVSGNKLNDLVLDSLKAGYTDDDIIIALEYSELFDSGIIFEDDRQVDVSRFNKYLRDNVINSTQKKRVNKAIAANAELAESIKLADDDLIKANNVANRAAFTSSGVTNVAGNNSVLDRALGAPDRQAAQEVADQQQAAQAAAAQQQAAQEIAAQSTRSAPIPGQGLLGTIPSDVQKSVKNFFSGPGASSPPSAVGPGLGGGSGIVPVNGNTGDNSVADTEKIISDLAGSIAALGSSSGSQGNNLLPGPGGGNNPNPASVSTPIPSTDYVGDAGKAINDLASDIVSSGGRAADDVASYINDIVKDVVNSDLSQGNDATRGGVNPNLRNGSTAIPPTDYVGNIDKAINEFASDIASSSSDTASSVSNKITNFVRAITDSSNTAAEGLVDSIAAIGSSSGSRGNDAARGGVNPNPTPESTPIPSTDSAVNRLAKGIADSGRGAINGLADSGSSIANSIANFGTGVASNVTDTGKRISDDLSRFGSDVIDLTNDAVSPIKATAASITGALNKISDDAVSALSGIINSLTSNGEVDGTTGVSTLSKDAEIDQASASEYASIRDNNRAAFAKEENPDVLARVDNELNYYSSTGKGVAGHELVRKQVLGLIRKNLNAPISNKSKRIFTELFEFMLELDSKRIPSKEYFDAFAQKYLQNKPKPK